jgi:hypothetical protein
MWYRSALNSLVSRISGVKHCERLAQRRARNRRPHFESLEGRCVLSTFAVLNLNDSGPDSLRDAVLAANAHPGPDTIGFATTGTIALTSGQIEVLRPAPYHNSGTALLLLH